MKKSQIYYILLLICFLVIGLFIYFQNNGSNPVQSKTEVAGEQSTITETMDNNLPPMLINKNNNYVAILKTTLGDIIIQLDPINTPVTVNNFVYLARKKFYDRTIFHRIINGFMIQGGDPKGNGTGGPGYRFNDEPIIGDYDRGTVAMANAGPNTNGSQFFIMHKDYSLQKNYVIFGKVIDGIDVVDKIATAPTDPEGEGSTPVNPVKIIAVEIVEK